MPDTRPEVSDLGPRALRVAVADSAAALDLARWLRAAELAEEVVPGAVTVVVDGVGDRAAVLASIRSWTPRPAPDHATANPVEVRVRYDGDDLEDVAELWGVRNTQVPQILADTPLESAFCGFAPGFAYLAGLPERLWVPRLDAPRSSVPAGSIAVADRWVGAYPTASPGGWRLLGRTDAVLFDVRRAEPALLSPGTRVRLVPM